MRKIKFEYRITAAYLIIGGIWIVFSDKLLNFFISDAHLLTEVQTYKGGFYVIITAVLFYSFLQKHLVKIRLAEQKAIQSDRLKTAFLQNISHEIRTPMNGIIGFSGLMADEDLSEEQRSQYLEMIVGSSNRLLKIVNEVLDISMIETGNISAREEAVNLNELLDEVYYSHQTVIRNEISFTFKKGLADTSAIILTDETKIRQILDNLLDNAIKFTTKGLIKFGYILNNNELEFFVEDTGIGIPPELHDNIFDRFHKAEKDTTSFYDGLGLGLSICKGNLELLKGKIWVESAPNMGSSFYFSIPYKPVIEKESAGIAENNNFSRLSNFSLLVVEDEEINYNYIKEILKGSGIELFHAVTGEEAVEYCRKNERISMVLMDIRLPEMNGYEATRLIRAIRPGLPVIAQSALALNHEREKALNAGCSDYISKPFRKDQLIALLIKHQPSKKLM